MKSIIIELQQQLKIEESMMNALQRKFDTGSYSSDLPSVLESYKNKVYAKKLAIDVLTKNQ